MRLLPLVALSVLLLGAATVQGALPDGIDARLGVPARGAPTEEDPMGILSLANATAGERVSWRLATNASSVAIEVRVERAAFDVERPQQVVPLLLLDEGEARCISVRAPGACDDATFVQSPNDRVWEAAGLARVFHLSGDAAGVADSSFTYRLNVPGPANGTLVLERDIRPPALTVAPPTDITPIGFLAQTRTDELAIVDLQVRAVGAQEWVLNPTSDLNVVQRFPIQGLHADTEYELRYVARDWSGNEAVTPSALLRTPPAPVVPEPVVTPLSPLPNATVDAADLTLRASIDPRGAGLADDGISVFIDRRPIASDLVYADGVLSYTPRAPLEPGPHSVAVEATNAEGGRGVARWSFTVAGGGSASVPSLPMGALALVAASAALLTRRSPR